MASIAKLETLVEWYLELDEEDQQTVDLKICELYMQKMPKEHILSQKTSKSSPKSKVAMQKLSSEDKAEISKRAADRLDQIKDFLSITDKLSPDKNAALFLAMYHLGLLNNPLEKTSVKISIIKRRMDIKEYIEEIFPDADYDTAVDIYKKQLAATVRETKVSVDK